MNPTGIVTFLIGPGSKNVDLLFNAFNFVNFGNPRSNIDAANPGRIDTAGDARIMQVGFRMTF